MPIQVKPDTTELKIAPDSALLSFIETCKLDFNQGNIIKYITRYKREGGLQDLLKAEFYIKRLIRLEQARAAASQKFPDSYGIEMHIEPGAVENIFRQYSPSTFKSFTLDVGGFDPIKKETK